MSIDGSASQEIDALRHQLRAEEGGLLDKYAARIDAIERGRPIFGLGAVFGAALTGTGRFVPETPGLIITVIGLVVSALSGGLVLWADYRKLELSREARTAMDIADKSLARADAFATDLDNEIRHRRAREDRLEAGLLMREAIAIGITSDLSIGEATDLALDMAKLRLVAAFGFEAAEYWAVTVFQEDAGKAEMTKIAALWNDATTSAGESRGWKKAEGFSELFKHLRRREEGRKLRMAKANAPHVTRFERGDAKVLRDLAKQSKLLMPEFKVIIVQPGLSKAGLATRQLDLLGATDLYLNDTSAISLQVIGSA